MWEGFFSQSSELLQNELILFGIFAGIIILFLIFDLGVFNKENKPVSLKHAFWLSVFWVVVSIAFGILVYFYVSPNHGYEFFLAYVVEKSLSIDNIFIFLVILQFFNIEEKYYHKILFWGILGAIFFRLLFLTLGLAVIDHFYWVLYIFGAILVFTGIKLLKTNQNEIFNPAESYLYKFLLKHLRYTDSDGKGRFFVKENGKIVFTTLFLALMLIEFTDIMFAIDSIPAVLAITQDPFVVYTSNIFAILGLRAMFFLLAGSIHHFPYIQQGLSFILIYIGIKMLLEIVDFYIPAEISLAIVLIVLSSSIIMSLVANKKAE